MIFLANDYKWYFHSWSSYKLRKSKIKGKDIVADPGVPMDKMGMGLDTVASRDPLR